MAKQVNSGAVVAPERVPQQSSDQAPPLLAGDLFIDAYEVKAVQSLAQVCHRTLVHRPLLGTKHVIEKVQSDGVADVIVQATAVEQDKIVPGGQARRDIRDLGWVNIP